MIREPDRKRIQVVKLGGSLLEWPGLTGCLGQWLADQPPTINLLICGGGRPVADLRERAAREPLDDKACHWAAIRIMDEHSRYLAARMQGLPIHIAQIGELPDHSCFLECFPLLRQHSVLPRDWSVSSDALAAELAALLGVDEICLVKSALPDSPEPDDWAATGFVDRRFPAAARKLKWIEVKDLRTGRSLSKTPG